MLRFPLVLSLLVSLLAAGSGFAGTTTILNCTFDAEPLDTLIGQGGAAAGQPITRGGAPAYVRAAPYATPSLEIGDDSSTTAEFVRFEFLNDWAILTGTLEISMNLWFHTLDGYLIYVRERTNSAVPFLSLRLDSGGAVRYGDIDSPGATQIGTYTTGSSLPLVITFDLDAGTYDVSLGGTMIRTTESMGSFVLGIGGIMIGANFDGDFDGLVSVDDLRVTATETPSPVDPRSWAETKAAWRSE